MRARYATVSQILSTQKERMVLINKERREIARKLRETNVRRKFYSPWCRMVESVLDGIDCGEDDGTCDENTCCERFIKRIADLIDQGNTTEDCHDNVICGREALLELADDLVYASENVDNVAYIDQTFIDSARRIREACGIKDGEDAD